MSYRLGNCLFIGASLIQWMLCKNSPWNRVQSFGLVYIIVVQWDLFIADYLINSKRKIQCHFIIWGENHFRWLLVKKFLKCNQENQPCWNQSYFPFRLHLDIKSRQIGLFICFPQLSPRLLNTAECFHLSLPPSAPSLFAFLSFNL